MKKYIALLLLGIAALLEKFGAAFQKLGTFLQKAAPPEADLDLNLDLPPTLEQLEEYLFSVAGRRKLLRHYNDPALLVRSAIAETAWRGLHYIQGDLRDCSENKEVVRAQARKELDFLLKEWSELPLDKGSRL